MTKKFTKNIPFNEDYTLDKEVIRYVKDMKLPVQAIKEMVVDFCRKNEDFNKKARLMYLKRSLENPNFKSNRAWSIKKEIQELEKESESE